MEPLTGPIRPYPWGSRTAIAQLQGRPVPSQGPEAELWLGAHPDSPARTADGPLDALIAADPAGYLGETVVAGLGSRLPFLLKLLAAAEPLSLQAHPDAEQARAGYAAGDPNYRDPSYKPELLVAVGEFHALCGFRAPAESAESLAELHVPALAPVVIALRDGDLRTAVDTLLNWPERERIGLLADVVANAGSRHAVVYELARYHPADVGVVVALLLNRVRLTPGEGIWMPAGNLHAYLRGTGIEIMAASDNVLRGGLTGKRVDVPELMKILRFEVLADPVVRPVPVAPGVLTWPVPVPDFALYLARVAGFEVAVPVTGPRVAFCHTGRVRVDDGVAAVELSAGQAAFGPAGAKPLAVAGDGDLYVGTTGIS